MPSKATPTPTPTIEEASEVVQSRLTVSNPAEVATALGGENYISMKIAEKIEHLAKVRDAYFAEKAYVTVSPESIELDKQALSHRTAIESLPAVIEFRKQIAAIEAQIAKLPEVVGHTESIAKIVAQQDALSVAELALKTYFDGMVKILETFHTSTDDKALIGAMARLSNHKGRPVGSKNKSK